MIKLGILGLGSRSTIFYMSQLNDKFNKQELSYSTLPFILINTNFHYINPFLPNDFEKLKLAIIPYLNNFEEVGIQYLLVPNITLHETIDMILIEKSYSFELIHPLKLALDELVKRGGNQIIILGSKYTMGEGYIYNFFKREGIKVNVFSNQMIDLIDSIRKEIYEGNFSGKYKLDKIISGLPSKITPVIACTELSLLINNSNNIIDMAQLQISETLKQFVEKK